MDFETNVRKLVMQLIKDTPFELTTFQYDAEHFGNMVAILDSKDISVRFIQDRSVSWCELTVLSDKKWWSFEDILKLLHIEANVPHQDFMECMETAMELIGGNLMPLLDAFSDPQIIGTKMRLKTIQEERVRQMFGRN